MSSIGETLYTIHINNEELKLINESIKLHLNEFKVFLILRGIYQNVTEENYTECLEATLKIIKPSGYRNKNFICIINESFILDGYSEGTNEKLIKMKLRPISIPNLNQIIDYNKKNYDKFANKFNSPQNDLEMQKDYYIEFIKRKKFLLTENEKIFIKIFNK
jgi:hypothetical protein